MVEVERSALIAGFEALFAFEDGAWDLIVLEETSKCETGWTGCYGSVVRSKGEILEAAILQKDLYGMDGKNSMLTSDDSNLWERHFSNVFAELCDFQPINWTCKMKALKS